MTTTEHEVQARAYHNFHRRHGGTLEGDFSLWSRSKHFQPEDDFAIRELVQADALGTCERVVTDLAEWSRVSVDGQQTTDYLLP